MCQTSHTLAIDFGSKYVGIALVRHTGEVPNSVLYACTLVVLAKPLSSLVETRASVRHMRRTRKTHARRLRRLRQALDGIPGADQLLRFCRRRGYGHDPEEGEQAEEITFRISREQFFEALAAEIEQRIPPEHRDRVLAMCARHLNRDRKATQELRPARFSNRGRSRCNWEGCNRNTPQAKSAVKERLEQSLFLWLQPIFQESADPERLRKSIHHWTREL